jgi:hypothetical protein
MAYWDLQLRQLTASRDLANSAEKGRRSFQENQIITVSESCVIQLLSIVSTNQLETEGK